MADMELTREQSLAVNSSGGALLVSAAAGSGKTMVLVERLMRYITDEKDPCGVGDFLIITYTNAAAAELRVKIRAAINRRLAESPRDRYLRREADMCFRAHIGTIHSFCVELLRENASMLGLSPDFRVADEGESDLIRRDVLEKLLEEKYDQMTPDDGFSRLADLLGAGRDDKMLTELILETYKKLRCHPYPEKWASEQSEKLRAADASDITETDWGSFLMARAKTSVAYWKGRLENLLITGDEAFVSSYSAGIEETCDALEAFLNIKTWDEAAGVSIPFNGGRVKGCDAEKKVRETCRDKIRKVMAVFNAPSDMLLSDLRASAYTVEELMKLTLDFGRAYDAEKLRRGLIDFSDQEHLAVKLLIDPETRMPTETAKEVSKRFREIMIDEYQDVNEVQELIFSAVSQKGQNLFMVGDVKQSIYRFRLADPSIFLRKYKDYSSVDIAEEGEPRKVLLQSNFRSRQGIIDAVNRVFSSVMSEGFGEMDYTDNEALKFGPSEPTPDNGEITTELCLVDLASDDDDEEESPGKAEAEAQYAASRIEDMVGKTLVSDGAGGLRPAEYGDFAILMRTKKDNIGFFAAALAERGIPFSSETGSGSLTSPEVTMLLSILAVIDNPRQDIPLVSVLRCPVWGFTPDELAKIRLKKADVDLWTALNTAGETDEKCAAFLRQIEEFRDAAPDMNVSELIWHICGETGFFGVAGALRPESGAGNVEALITCARVFEKNGYRGLYRFLQYVKMLTDRGEDISAPPKEANAVRIMSIHKSKGLEFPVVFLAGLSRNINMSDTARRVLIHPDLGVGVKVADRVLRAEFATVSRMAIARKIKEETFSEELRVLYVAMTRAKEKLIMLASLQGADKEIDKYSCAETPISPEILLGTSRMCDWIMLTALKDKAAAERLKDEGEITDGGWLIKQVGAVKAASKTQRQAEAVTAPADGELVRQIGENLAFVYPHKSAENQPSKLTATEIKSRLKELEAAEDALTLISRPKELRHPDFSPKDTLTAAEKGTAMHLVMQYADMNACLTPEGAKGEIGRLEKARTITPQQAKSIRPQLISRFMSSDLGQRIRNADRVLREFKFSILVPVRELLGGDCSDEVLLQGVVDCCIEEKGELTVIDYKTDYVTPETAEERAKEYSPQLSAYALAMERVTGKKVKESVLWFFSADKVVTVKNS